MGQRFALCNQHGVKSLKGYVYDCLILQSRELLDPFSPSGIFGESFRNSTYFITSVWVSFARRRPAACQALDLLAIASGFDTFLADLESSPKQVT